MCAICLSVCAEEEEEEAFSFEAERRHNLAEMVYSTTSRERKEILRYMAALPGDSPSWTCFFSRGAEMQEKIAALSIPCSCVGYLNSNKVLTRLAVRKRNLFGQFVQCAYHIPNLASCMHESHMYCGLCRNEHFASIARSILAAAFANIFFFQYHFLDCPFSTKRNSVPP